MQILNWGAKDFESFANEANQQILSPVLFSGSVKELFNEKNEFSSELIEEFGKNPNEDSSEYLMFLKEYYRGFNLNPLL